MTTNMKSLNFACLFLIFIILSLKSLAQGNIKIEAKNEKLKNDLIRTIRVNTSDLKSKKNIGKVYLDVKKISDLGFEKDISSVFLKYFNAFENNRNAPELVMKVEILDLTEKLLYASQVEGKIAIEIAASLVIDGDTNSLCRARARSKYQRSVSLKSYDDINNEIKVCMDNCYFFILSYIKKNKGVLENYAEASKVIIKPFKTVSSPDTVYYQQRKVAWSDFRGPIRSRTDYGAAIFASFGYASKLYTENGQISMEISPKIFMDKNMSWVRSEMQTPYALAHEQLHFDIAYALSLQFLTKIKGFKAKTEKNLLSMVNYEYLEFYKKMHKIQEQYDSETEHSLNKAMQEKWAKKTKAEIASFDLNNLYK